MVADFAHDAHLMISAPSGVIACDENLLLRVR